MRGLWMLVVAAVMAGVLASCNSDDGWSGWGFRNLGKRDASKVDGEHAKR